LLDRRVELTIDGLEAASYRLRHRRLDEEHSNLNAAWAARSGGRAWPEDGDWDALRERDRLELLEPERVVRPEDRAVRLDIALPMPAVSLLELEPAG
jgi:xylan 1,4-beta-xylosidase